MARRAFEDEILANLKWAFWTVLGVLGICLLTSTPGGSFLVGLVRLVVVLRALTFIIKQMMAGVVMVQKDLFDLARKIKITVKRPPSKAEMADWIIGEHKAARRKIDQLPIPAEERRSLHDELNESTARRAGDNLL